MPKAVYGKAAGSIVWENGPIQMNHRAVVEEENR
jgi:hypothetical protein